MKKIFTLTLLLMSVVLTAQDSTEVAKEKKFTLSGSVDAYFRANLTAPNDENAIAPGSSSAKYSPLKPIANVSETVY